MAKRMLDILVSSFALLLLSPVLCFIAVLVKISHGSPIFFKQERPGLDGESFQIFKFRTMTNERNSKGDLLPDKQRLTALGRLLRSTSLDELPEFLNVIKGDMSLVGPRPLLMEYIPLYTAKQARRHEVKPGMTGWAQVNGRNSLSWEEKFKLDVWYVDNHDLCLDLKILCLTLLRVIQRQGISAENEATMPKFKGGSSSDGQG